MTADSVAKSIRGVLAVALFLASGAMGCRRAPKGPEATLPLAPVTKADLIGEFAATMAVTVSVDKYAIRRPSLDAMVDAQTKAMVEYVEKHGRGEFDRSGFAVARTKTASASSNESLARLDRTALRLFSFLELDSGPRELGQVALAALAKELGDDAAYRAVEADGAVDTADVVPEMRDAIGLLRVPHMGDKTVEHALAILAQWAANNPPLRAVVLDLSRCQGGGPANATGIVNVFAPGESAFISTARDTKTGEIDRREWHGKAGWSASVYARIPLFVVTSSHSDPLAEAVTLALRHHRTARVLGSITHGTGQMMIWQDMPWNMSFGFTVAELMDPEGRPLRGLPVIPDACLRDTRFVRVPERTVAAYREQCGDVDGDVPKEMALEYVRTLLVSEEPAPPVPAPSIVRSKKSH